MVTGSGARSLSLSFPAPFLKLGLTVYIKIFKTSFVLPGRVRPRGRGGPRGGRPRDVHAWGVSHSRSLVGGGG